MMRMSWQVSVLRLQKLIYAMRSEIGRRALWYGVGASVEHVPALRGQEFSTVIDVGANRGQFSVFARTLYPQARIFSFEPLPAAGACFRKIFARDDKVTLYSVALGDVDGVTALHVAAKNDSSSLLPIGPAQRATFGTREVDTVPVEVLRLDEVLSTNDISRPALLKIDVQGAEAEVLRGCRILLGCVDAVYLEGSYIELYQGQKLISEIRSDLVSFGFALHGTFNEATDANGIVVQADFLFFAQSSSFR